MTEHRMCPECNATAIEVDYYIDDRGEAPVMSQDWSKSLPGSAPSISYAISTRCTQCHYRLTAEDLSDLYHEIESDISNGNYDHLAEDE